MMHGTGPAARCRGARPGIRGEVSKLVDEHDLGSCAAKRGSSSLPFPTTAPPPGMPLAAFLRFRAIPVGIRHSPLFRYRRAFPPPPLVPSFGFGGDDGGGAFFRGYKRAAMG